MVLKPKKTSWRKIASEASKDEGAPKIELSKIGYKSIRGFFEKLDVFMNFRDWIRKVEEVSGPLRCPEQAIGGVPFGLKDHQTHGAGLYFA
jgi:hypothetical protein